MPSVYVPEGQVPNPGSRAEELLKRSEFELRDVMPDDQHGRSSFIESYPAVAGVRVLP